MHSYTYSTCVTPLVDWLLVRPKLDMGPETELLAPLLILLMNTSSISGKA